MHGVSYAILTLRNSCSVGYLLPSLETFHSTVKVRLSGNLSIGKIALAAYFHRAHYNSPMALAAYFCCYLAKRGISRAVPKVSESSTRGAVRTNQLTRRPRLVFITAHIKIVDQRSPFSLTAESIYRHTQFPKRAGQTNFYCTITEKNISLFTDVAIYEVKWYVIKQKKDEASCTTQPKQIFTVLLITKTFALFLEPCARL
jgi:hypothetical protein